MVRPPSLPPLPGVQDHTFFADNAAAFAALPPAEQAAAAAREVLHCNSIMGRTKADVARHPGVGAPPSDAPVRARLGHTICRLRY